MLRHDSSHHLRIGELLHARDLSIRNVEDVDVFVAVSGTTGFPLEADNQSALIYEHKWNGICMTDVNDNGGAGLEDFLRVGELVL